MLISLVLINPVSQHLIWGSEVFPKFRRSLWPNGEITGVVIDVPRSKPGKATLFLATVCFTTQENVIAMLGRTCGPKGCVTNWQFENA
jgi:hypothetical protein